MAGCIACVIALSGVFPIEYAFLCTAYSLIADFFDGFSARWLKAQSPIGLQLDSLADMVSFGLFPGVLIFYCFNQFVYDSSLVLSHSAFLITLSSAYRLAKFNIDSEQSTYFKGLATPANTILCIGVFYFLRKCGAFNFISSFLIAFSCLSSVLLVCNLPLFSFKSKSFISKNFLPQIIFITTSAILFLIFREIALAPIIILYIFLSIVFKKSFKK